MPCCTLCARSKSRSRACVFKAVSCSVRVFDRNRRLASHAGQHVEIVLRKAAALIDRIDLDHAQGGCPTSRPAARTSSSGCESRPRFGWNRSACRWRRRPRGWLLSTVITWLTIVRLMRMVSSTSRAAVLTALGTSVWRSLSHNTMNPRSACRKILNRLSSTRPSTSTIAMVVPRLRVISSRALSFISGLAPICSPARVGVMSSVDMIVVPASGSSTSMAPLADGRLVGAGRQGGVDAAGLGRMEGKQQIADLDLIVIVERVPAADHFAIDESAIAALQIFDVELIGDTQDLRMLAADRADIEDDIAFRMAAENIAFAFQRELLPGIQSPDHLQHSHGWNGTLRSAGRPAAGSTILPRRGQHVSVARALADL